MSRSESTSNSSPTANPNTSRSCIPTSYAFLKAFDDGLWWRYCFARSIPHSRSTRVPEALLHAYSVGLEAFGPGIIRTRNHSHCIGSPLKTFRNSMYFHGCFVVESKTPRQCLQNHRLF